MSYLLDTNAVSAWVKPLRIRQPESGAIAVLQAHGREMAGQRHGRAQQAIIGDGAGRRSSRTAPRRGSRSAIVAIRSTAQHEVRLPHPTMLKPPLTLSTWPV